MTTKQNGTVKWIGTAIAITTLIVTATLTFASKADRSELEQVNIKLNQTCERLTEAETRGRMLEAQLGRMESKLDRLLERDGGR